MFRSLLCILAFVVACTNAVAQTYSQWGDLKPGPFSVGFMSIVRLDYSRDYQADMYDGQRNRSALRSRPIQINVWYPAKALKGDAYMSFADHLGLAEIENREGGPSKKGRDRATEAYIRRWIAAGISSQRVNAYLRNTTTAS